MKYTTAQDIKLDIEFVLQNSIEFYSPAVEKVRVKLASYESIQIRHRSFSISPNVKTDSHTPSSFGSETWGGEMGRVH
jgi:hypothetical protein